jgi:hypothetical protein
MKWLWPSLAFRDLLGIAILLAILGVLAVLSVGYPGIFRRNTNAGFGPDWECTQAGRGDPICVKRIDRP